MKYLDVVYGTQAIQFLHNGTFMYVSCEMGKV